MSRMAFDMKEACRTCPFRSDIPLVGRGDWLLDVIKGFKTENLSHSCHATDPAADGYLGARKKQHCIGILGMMKNMDTCISQDAIHALVEGSLDWEKVPTKNIWKDLNEMARAYVALYRKIARDR